MRVCVSSQRFCLNWTLRRAKVVCVAGLSVTWRRDRFTPDPRREAPLRGQEGDEVQEGEREENVCQVGPNSSQLCIADYFGYTVRWSKA